jgi:hypothetical protein
VELKGGAQGWSSIQTAGSASNNHLITISRRYTFSLSGYRVVGDHVEYRVQVSALIPTLDSSRVSRLELVSLAVWRRYSSFKALASALRRTSSVTRDLPFPPRQALPHVGGRFKKPPFVLHRMQLLERWLFVVVGVHAGGGAGCGRRGAGGGGMEGVEKGVMDVLLKRFLVGGGKERQGKW